jgi:hypothetical protein
MSLNEPEGVADRREKTQHLLTLRVFLPANSKLHQACTMGTYHMLTSRPIEFVVTQMRRTPLMNFSPHRSRDRSNSSRRSRGVLFISRGKSRRVRFFGFPCLREENNVF